MLRTIRSILSLGSSSSLVPTGPVKKASEETLHPDAISVGSSPVGSPTRRDAYEMPSLAKDIEASIVKEIDV